MDQMKTLYMHDAQVRKVYNSKMFSGVTSIYENIDSKDSLVSNFNTKKLDCGTGTLVLQLN